MGSARRTAVIVGAGPAGLTAAAELLDRTDIRPIVLEASGAIGGLAQTVNYKGNRMDIGGHRFFSKSDRVMRWWLDKLPLEAGSAGQAAGGCCIKAAGRPCCHGRWPRSGDDRSRDAFAPSQEPDLLSAEVLRLSDSTQCRHDRQAGPVADGQDRRSYGWAVLFPNKAPQNLEEFFISRFGRELYRTFFQSYTEKVWGRKCHQIIASGAQRVKGLSIAKTLTHILKKAVARGLRDIAQSVRRLR